MRELPPEYDPEKQVALIYQMDKSILEQCDQIQALLAAKDLEIARLKKLCESVIDYVETYKSEIEYGSEQVGYTPHVNERCADWRSQLTTPTER